MPCVAGVGTRGSGNGSHTTPPQYLVYLSRLCFCFGSTPHPNTHTRTHTHTVSPLGSVGAPALLPCTRQRKEDELSMDRRSCPLCKWCLTRAFCAQVKHFCPLLMLEAWEHSGLMVCHAYLSQVSWLLTFPHCDSGKGGFHTLWAEAFQILMTQVCGTEAIKMWERRRGSKLPLKGTKVCNTS